MRRSAKVLGVGIVFALVASALVWYAALREDRRGTLAVTFLSVGQGDAILVEAPSGRTVLIDGGQGDEVLRQLGGVMPFYDRSLDVVIATAPEAQKVGGLASVLARFRVGAVVRSAARSSIPQEDAFDAAVASAEESGTHVVVAQRGQVVDLGDGAFIEILFPDRDASSFAPGDGCLILKLIFGGTSFLFSCGSSALEKYLATLDGPKLQSNVLAAAGDDSELFAGFAAPQFAVLPCDTNATTSVFTKLHIQMFDTCDGTIKFVSDGQTVTRE